MSDRPTLSEYMMKIAQVTAERSTCGRRKVGCVIVDKDGMILSTGYNGVPMGSPHCSDRPCPAAQAESGTKLDGCRALHAEQNAIARLADWKRAKTIYCTTQPCMSCIKLIAVTKIDAIYFDEAYPSESKRYWLSLPGKRLFIQQSHLGWKNRLYEHETNG